MLADRLHPALPHLRLAQGDICWRRRSRPMRILAADALAAVHASKNPANCFAANLPEEPAA